MSYRKVTHKHKPTTDYTYCGRRIEVQTGPRGQERTITKLGYWSREVTCRNCRNAMERDGERFPEPQMVERTTMFGDKFMEREDTPYTASPRSETYWSS